VVAGGVVSGFAFLLLTGSYLNDGPVVLRLSANHGLHAGDLFVFLGWLAAMAALGWLAPRRVRDRDAAAVDR
jgi:hypothetical protein